MAIFRRINAAIALFPLLFILACNSPIPNPENLDPIYADLKKEADSVAKSVETQREELKTLVEEIKKYPPRDPNRTRALREQSKREKMLVQHEQMALYYKIRADQRLEFDRKDYLRSFQAEKPWPDPNEYQEYLARKKLQTASRNWEDRVPKTTRYNKVVLSSEGKKGKKEGGEAPKGE